MPDFNRPPQYAAREATFFSTPARKAAVIVPILMGLSVVFAFLARSCAPVPPTKLIRSADACCHCAEPCPCPLTTTTK